ncbi:MAG TPA: dockerin type I domain-containing protein [Planctomycetota bacterium]|nr:dockerin type I domain-containing protein [Planctomycetota bacterium]
MSFNNIDLTERKLLFTLMYDYEITPLDDVTTYTIDVDPMLTLLGDPDNQEIPLTIATGSVGFTHTPVTIYVDDDAPGDPGPGNVTVSDPAEDGSYAHPFDAIQEAVDRAYDTDTVIVMDGTYRGAGNRDINLLGRRITLRSMNGPSKTTIDCQGTAQDRHRAFTFDHGETASTVVSGFTVTGGNEVSGGGIACSGASPTLQNMIIHGNSASNGNGGGVYCSYSMAVIQNCTITSNSASGGAGGIHAANSTPDINSCIVWGNGDDLLGCSAIYSCIEDGDAGTGNLAANPQFAGPAANDFHLKSEKGRWDPAANGGAGAWVLDTVSSPCIDAGDPSLDYTTEPQPNGSRINMGAYGNTVEASIHVPPKYDMNVSSTGTTGVTITGDAPGTTNYVAKFFSGTVVSLAAPATVVTGQLHYNFVRWTVDGTDRPDGQLGIQVTVTTGNTAVAAYTLQKYTLTVQSAPPAVSITGTAPGTTPYTADMNDQTTVSLTAPGTMTVGESDYVFLRWKIDGADRPLGQTIVVVIMDAAHTANAVYEPAKRTLTVQSTPVTGANISGDKPGTTNYVATCDDNQTIALTAPAAITAGAVNYDLLRWTVGGQDQPQGQASVQFAINVNTTAIAIYEIHKQTLTVRSTPAPTAAITGDKPGTTDYTVQCNDQQGVSLIAPTTMIADNTHYNFVRWNVDGIDQPLNQTALTVVMTGPRTATAIYDPWKHTLNVQSVPATGVAITGDKPGTTNYSATCDENQTITLTAPSQSGSLFFARWKDAAGNTLSARLSYTFAVPADMTVIVEYDIVRNFYVNDAIAEDGISAGDNQNSGMSADAPMASIQALLNKYPNIGTECTVHVSAGTYFENIVLTSTHSGLALSGAGWDRTTINGNHTASVIRLTGFTSGTISGFTITNGYSMTLPNNNGGGINIEVSSSALVTNNRLIGNTASKGGGIYCAEQSSPVITNNLISGNNADRGGGIRTYLSTAVITGNMITGNTGVRGGGLAIQDSASIVSNNVVAGNDATDGGGGIYFYLATTSLANNTVAINSSTTYGGGIYSYGSANTIRNFILWGNTAAYGSQIAIGTVTRQSSIVVTYCDVAGAQAGVFKDTGCTLTWGAGNVNVDPLFAGSGDYHLKSENGRWDPAANSGAGGWVADAVSSPCIDAGDPASAYANEPSPNGARVNLGAYGNTAYASMSAPTRWTLTVQSTPITGVAITGGKPGTTNYSAICNIGDSVTLTAPQSTGNYSFVRWKFDGADQADGQVDVHVTMGADHTVIAVYQAGPATLSVQSTPITGINITGDKPGNTDYTAVCTNGEIVSLTAPATAPGNYSFVRWTLDGTDQPLGQAAIQVTMSSDRTVVAVYHVLTFSLTVRSTPIGGISIDGTRPGTTEYSTTCNNAEVVNLTAAGTAAPNYVFSRWRLDGNDLPVGQTGIQITMNADIIVTAIYEIPTFTLSVQSSPITGIAISGTKPGTADYSAVCNNLDVVNLIAPDAPGQGYHFVRWTLDGSNQPAAQAAIQVTMAAEHTVVAIYERTPATLSVQSAPAPGVAITGDAAGTTNYQAACYVEQPISLTAPWQAGGLFFLRWMNGQGDTLALSAVYSFAIAGDTTVIAEYGAVAQFYVNDATPDGDVEAGDNSRPGTSPEAAVASIHVLLDRYPGIGTGCTVNVSPGAYAENVTIGSGHSGLKLAGASASTTVIDGTGTGSCLVLNQMAAGTITGIAFIGGKAASGAGISMAGSSPTIANCIVAGNAATADGGGILCDAGSAPVINNVTITGNRAAAGGGICATASAAPAVKNSIAWGNTATQGAQLALKTPCSMSVLYCVVAGGQAAALVEAGSTLTWGAGNVYADPLFADSGHWNDNGTPADPSDDTWVNGDYHEKSRTGRWNRASGTWLTDSVESPAIDAGDPAAAYALEPTPNLNRLNSGAFGNTSEASKSGWSILGDVTGDCNVNILDLLQIRNALGQSPGTGSNWKYNVNKDASINILDLLVVRNMLSTKCK